MITTDEIRNATITGVVAASVWKDGPLAYVRLQFKTPGEVLIAMPTENDAWVVVDAFNFALEGGRAAA